MVTHGEIFDGFERVTRAVGRKINPAVYTARGILKTR